MRGVEGGDPRAGYDTHTGMNPSLNIVVEPQPGLDTGTVPLVDVWCEGRGDSWQVSSEVTRGLTRPRYKVWPGPAQPARSLNIILGHLCSNTLTALPGILSPSLRSTLHRYTGYNTDVLVSPCPAISSW